MKSNTLHLSLVIALSLATLVACDKHGKKSEDAAATAPANTAVATAPAATTVTTPATVAAAPTVPAAGSEVAGGKRAWKLACADDIKKFCADSDKPGKCLKEHKSELSQACSAAREAARAAHRAEKADKGE